MHAAKEYVGCSQMQVRDNNELLDEFKEEISKMHNKCLDIGCGPGNFTRHHLLPKLPFDTTIMGCDISRDMIEYAKTTNEDERRLSFMQLDIQTEFLPLNQIGSYDNIFSFYCLHWCINMRKTFENIYQLLRPGGKCLVDFLADCSFFDAMIKVKEHQKFAPYMDVSKYIPYFKGCNNAEGKMTTILKDCGFEVIHCSVRDKTFQFENLDILNIFAQSVNPFTKQVPLSIRDEYNNHFLHVLTDIQTLLGPPDQYCQTTMTTQHMIAYVKKN